MTFYVFLPPEISVAAPMRSFNLNSGFWTLPVLVLSISMKYSRVKLVSLLKNEPSASFYLQTKVLKYCFDWAWHFCIVNHSQMHTRHLVFIHRFFLLLHDPLWLYYNIPCFLFASICLRTSWAEAHPQAPLASANYLLSHLHPTLNCLHAPQPGLSCSGVSHRCSCLTFRIPYFYTLGVEGLREGGVLTLS